MKKIREEIRFSSNLDLTNNLARSGLHLVCCAASALTNQKHYLVWVVKRHQYRISALALRRHFAGNLAVASRYLGCFLKLVKILLGLSLMWMTFIQTVFSLLLFFQVLSLSVHKKDDINSKNLQIYSFLPHVRESRFRNL